MKPIVRTKQPKISPDFNFEALKPEANTLANGCEIYHFPYSQQDVSKIDFIFPAGKFQQTKNLVAGMTSKMLLEGTKKRSNEDIVNFFEYYGASVDRNIDNDFACLTISCLNKNLKHILPLVYEILTESLFPQKQLNVILKNDRQNHLINLEKVSYLANLHFTKNIFGTKHPYGKPIEVKDFDNLKSEHLSEFYKSKYDFSNCKVIWVGNPSNSDMKLFLDIFGQKNHNLKFTQTERKKFKTIKTKGEIFIERANANQSALMIGSKFHTLNHEDFYGMKVLNTVLGGYFGSRLMKNLREKKGMTYGINSSLTSFIHSGIFYINTQVKSEMTTQAILEIKKELFRLIKEPVEKNEMELVKNYMLGALVRKLDGPFSQAAMFARLLLYGLDYHQYLNKLKGTIISIVPNEVQNLAKKYLNPDNLLFVISGDIEN